MGCKLGKEYDEGKQDSNEVEKQLRHLENSRGQEIKILMLGETTPWFPFRPRTSGREARGL